MISKKFYSTNEGFEVHDVDYPVIGSNDILVKVVTSFFSPGTERSSLEKIQQSSLKKAIIFHEKIFKLVKAQDYATLLKKVKKQRSLKLNTGYSIFGEVLQVGDKVDNAIVGQYVVCLGEKANHGSIATIPAGMVFPCNYNENYSAVALVSIALNASYIGKFSPFSKLLILGGGLIGQLLVQILKNMGHTVYVADIKVDFKNLTLSNGAKHFLDIDNLSLYDEYFDGIISTVPEQSKSGWQKLICTAKHGANIVLLGAADINVPRRVFYEKRINFFTAYSYGSGRGEYAYEIEGKKSAIETDSGQPIHKLVEKSLDLIERNLVKVDFVKHIDCLNLDGNIDDVFSGNYLGFQFHWFSSEQSKPFVNIDTFQKKISVPKNNYNGFDIIGDSSFFNDSHKPALLKIGAPIQTIFSRSPKSKTNKNTVERTNCLIVSTPHDQHWRNIQQAGNYDFLFVDKPIVINKSEFEEYISSSQKIIALMNRRFSEYTNVVKEFIEQDDQKCSLELSFSVQKKSPQDRIFFTGGRIIGEMCHHIDLCIFLNGPVKHVEFIAFDADKKRQKIEDCKFFLVHNNGNISSISYNQGTTPYWQKENLLVQKGDQYIVVKDFSKLITNSQKLKNISLKEKDKGCFNMWKTIVSRLGTQSQCFADFIALDKQVYNILFKVF